MLLSLNWLKTYINLPKKLSAKKLAHDLTMSTVEVESIESQADKFARIVVGKIIEIKNHPNADKLKIVITDIGEKQPAQIICGGTNLRQGMLVAVALPGSKVRWHGEGEPVELKETEIRGTKSFGMICASSEIGLEKTFPCGEREILDLGIKVQGATLNQQIKPGQNLAKVLNLDDLIIELDNKSITHRPDLWNHYGVARELAVIYGVSLKNVFSASNGKETKKLRNSARGGSASGGKEIKGNELNIKIQDKKLCPRYIGCLVKNVKIEPSPEWLVKRLESVGSRSINNIVDITNYVMLDVGEPMHAFDKLKVNPVTAGQKSKLSETEIIIRSAKKGEVIKTLDGVERKLDETVLVIADSKKPIALAGIMGGADSGVDEQTAEIILEAANFDSVNIRKTTQKLSVRTEASNRFEKKLPVEFSLLGMQRALELIKEILPEAEIYPFIDVNYAKPVNVKIKISHQFIVSRMGTEISEKEVKNILEKLGFEVNDKWQMTNGKKKELTYTISVPSWRSTGDINCEEDIVEEIARIYGYDNLANQPLNVSLSKPIIQDDVDLLVKTKEFLAFNAGLNEVFNYPWTSEFYLKKLGENAKMIMLANPPSEDNKRLQTSLIPNLIKNTEDNLRYLDEFGIFELSRIYNLDKSEPKMLGGAVVREKGKDAFLEVKGILENLLNILHITHYSLRITDSSENYLNPEKKLAVYIGDKRIGWLGELKKEIYNQFNFKNRNVCLFEINFDELIAVGTGRDLSAKKYQPLPQFPEVIRDLAFELEWDKKWESINDLILRHFVPQDDIAVNIEFLSEFDLGPKKSLAFRIIYQANRTLTDKEVDALQEKIIKVVEDKFDGRLRVSLKK